MNDENENELFHAIPNYKVIANWVHDLNVHKSLTT